MVFPKLETKRLHLTEITDNHARALYNIFSLNEVTKFYGLDNFKTIDDSWQIIDSFKNNFLAKRGIRWGIVHKESGEFIGTVGLNNWSSPNKRAEVGYELHPDYWRSGYTTEAVIKVLNYAFHDIGLKRIGAVVYPENISSSNLLKKIGFQQEGLLRDYIFQGGRSHDVNVYSLLMGEFKE
ncbi:GNAT family N-acetyltransferase [Bacillus sp. M6-12]|uniref:GNAT family N-acetyltransferase n=1 Tax=Bacillus sp. M6-12 TaxID=2054166 RepID=UPI000C76F778|nr:GNAT family protein [Bacillus sp. M6-12]PLS15446.1 GNAT family N-acetyltransferase [Bacillus sp. M6-12]